ncbi:MAG: phasin family protein [Rhodoplanes sp.]|jgi:phasin family protein|uniref:phasin family protein n=1 Tax=Rhodoplanes sp. TaxID=1968906 RepID=UPI0017A91465|nr:phasin family protein [Rhodoplanes sp.]NVO13568.1 phasin family protein [Rhodoplanes sp.]
MKTGTPFEMPGDIRKMTEQSMEQVRSAINSYLQFFQRGVPGMPALGGNELSNKVLSYAERNVATAFDFAQSLMAAKDVQEVLKMQTEFLQGQMQAMTEQVKDLSETAIKAVTDSAKMGGMPGMGGKSGPTS